MHSSFIESAPHFPRNPAPLARASESSTEANGEARVMEEANQPGCRSITACGAELSETKALRAFFRATGGRRWNRHYGWSTPHRDAPQVRLNEFEGVQVGRGGRVNMIRLSQNNITGLTKTSILSSFQHLTVLDLSRNSLRGGIPKALAMLPLLEEVDLHGNNLAGKIPAELGQLHRLKRLRLSENYLLGAIPEAVRTIATLELLDCSNTRLQDLLPAWACIGAVHAETGDPNGTQLYLFVMAAAPSMLLGGISAYAHEARARLRAAELVQWHLDTARRPLVLGQTQARLVALPQHTEATIQFEVKLDGFVSRDIAFGAAGGIPKSVFGAVVDDLSTITLEGFPHEVVETSGDGTKSVHVEGQRGSVENPVQASQRPRNDQITLESDLLFADSWEERVRLNKRCSYGFYNFLKRFGLKRARNRLIFFVLTILVVRFLGHYTAGLIVGALMMMINLAVVKIECIVRSNMGPSHWADMPVLSFVIRQ